MDARLCSCALDEPSIECNKILKLIYSETDNIMCNTIDGVHDNSVTNMHRINVNKHSCNCKNK